MKSKLVKASRLSGLLIIQLLIAALLGVVLLTTVYAIPTDRIERNVRVSAEKIADEGCYPQLFGWCSSQLDNWTDSIMLLGAAHNDGDSALKNAMQSEYGRIDGVSPCATLVAHYTRQEPFSYNISYSRYWHGYMVFLKPLLYITNYENIRCINGILQGMLLSILIMLMVYKEAKEYIIPVLLSYGLLMPVVIAQSLQYSSCFYISVIGSIILMLLKDRVNKEWVFLSLFLWLGILTSFFDFLTYPIITYCIPASLYFCLFNRTTKLSAASSALVKTGGSWLLGYGGMWASKWVIGSIILRTNLIEDATKQAERRSSFGGDSQITLEYILKAIEDNLRAFFKTPVFWLILVFVVIILARLMLVLLKNKQAISWKQCWVAVFTHTVIACLPFGWYMCMSNHSYVHSWFTNKALAGTVFAGITLLVHIELLAKKKQNSQGAISP